MGVLAKVDRTVLAAHCEAWAQWVDLVKRLEGMDMEAPSYWRLALAKHRALEALVKLSDRLGFNPAARARLRTEPPRKNEGEEGKGRFFQVG